MRLKNSLFARNKVVCVVLHERCSFRILHSFCHDLHDPEHGCCLPVSLRAESVSLLHQSLDCKARQLFEAPEISEVCYDRLIVLVLQKTLKSDLNLSLYSDVASEFLRISSLKEDVICIIIFVHKRIHFAFPDVFHGFCDLIYRISVNFPSESDLRLDFISVSDRNVSHIIRHSHNPYMAAFDDSHCRTHPGCDLLLYLFIGPVPHHNFSLDSHTGKNVAELPPSVSRLIFIHKIHIDRVIRNLHIELCMQMEQRLSVFLKSQNP